MKKIRNLILAGLMIALSGEVFSQIKANQNSAPSIEAKADTLPVNEFDSIAGGWNPNQTNLTNYNRCQYVLQFKNKWKSDGTKDSTNLVSTLGDAVKLNGQSFASYDNATLAFDYDHGGKYLQITIPCSLITPAANSTKALVHIDAGTPFYEYSLPELDFSIDCESYSMKALNQERHVSFVKVNWNNALYNTTTNAGLFDPEYEPNPILIDNGANAIPSSGYCALIEFDYIDSANKSATTDNFAYDPNYMFSSMMSINGVPVSELQGVKVNELMGFLYFYFPASCLQNSKQYQYPTVKFVEGILLGDMYLPQMEFRFKGSLGQRGYWFNVRSEYRGIKWNKTNKDSATFGDKQGLLINYNEKIFDGTSENLVSQVGQFITLNGTSIKSYPDAEVRAYNSNALWVYTSAMNTVNGSMNTLECKQIVINNKAISGFKYSLLPGEGEIWNSHVSTGTRYLDYYYNAAHDFYGSAWPSNNIYEATGYHELCGGTYANGAKEGFLLSYNDNLVTDKSLSGKYKYVNLAQEKIGHHVYLNGVPFCDIDGAELMYYQEGHIWLWTPEFHKAYEGKNYAEITIDEGAVIFDTIIHETHIYHENLFNHESTWSKDSLWQIKGTKDYQGPTQDRNEEYLTLDEMTPDLDTWLGPFTWNNHDGDGTTIICYGSEQSDNKVNESDPDPVTTKLCKSVDVNGTNVGSKYFTIGYKLTLNDVPICQITGSTVNYQNGANYLSIIIPETSIGPFNGYKVPTLKLEDGTDFYDVSLQEFEIYWNENKWQKAPIDSVKDETLSDAMQYSDVFDKYSFNETDYEVSGTATNNDALTFEYRAENDDAAFAINMFGKDNNTGISMVFDIANKCISLNDASGNGKQIGKDSYNAKLSSGEWVRVYLKVALNGNNASIVVAIDDLYVCTFESVAVNNINDFGSNLYLYTNGENIVFRDTNIGASIKNPTLKYYGKDTYRFYVGDVLPDLTPYFAANELNTVLTDEIVITYQEGMLDADDKLNKGTFYVTASVTSSSGAVVSKQVKIIVTDPNEVVVTFNGENPTVYTIGDKINKPTEIPTKEDSNHQSYEFYAWLYNGAEWDFENDYVTQDMDLVAGFISHVTEYAITITTKGIGKNVTYTMYMVPNAVISVSMFAKDGYDVKMYVNGEEVSTCVVTGDMNIELVYTSTTAKKGCKGDITSTSLILALTSILAIGLVSLKRKEER